MRGINLMFLTNWHLIQNRNCFLSVNIHPRHYHVTIVLLKYQRSNGWHKNSLFTFPHLFNDLQLCRFFSGTDGLNADKRSLNREYIAPVLFRMIYVCGLRNSEVCTVRKKDIGLQRGNIRVIYSKGDKDRNVFMDGMLVDLCRRFDMVYSSMLPERGYFFQISGNRLYPTKYNADDWFDLILKKTGLDKKFSAKLTVHSIRHLFAVKSMKKCLGQGAAFGNWIKYPSKYMGHESTEETIYYLHMVEALMPEYQAKISRITEGIEVPYEAFCIENVRLNAAFGKQKWVKE